MTENTARFSTYTGARVEYWTEFAGSFSRWQRPRKYYQKRLADIYCSLIPPGMRVLEVGCGRGDLLAALRPAYGVGVDFSPAMIEIARGEYPHLRFVEGDAHSFDLGQTFDYIVCSDLLNDLWDVQTVLENIARHLITRAP